MKILVPFWKYISHHKRIKSVSRPFLFLATRLCTPDPYTDKVVFPKTGYAPVPLHHNSLTASEYTHFSSVVCAQTYWFNKESNLLKQGPPPLDYMSFFLLPTPFNSWPSCLFQISPTQSRLLPGTYPGCHFVIVHVNPYMWKGEWVIYFYVINYLYKRKEENDTRGTKVLHKNVQYLFSYNLLKCTVNLLAYGTDSIIYS